MDKFIAISTLVVAATATLPNPVMHLDRRQIEIPPEVASSLPSDCVGSLGEMFDTMPPEPTPIAEFSSSFYETASRTATATGEECAWITNMPDDVTDTYLEWTDDFIKWVNEGNNQKDIVDFGKECWDAVDAALGTATTICMEEWHIFKDKAEADGWTPPKIVVNTDSDSDPASSGSLNIRAYAAAAVAATLVGAMALL